VTAQLQLINIIIIIIIITYTPTKIKTKQIFEFPQQQLLGEGATM